MKCVSASFAFHGGRRFWGWGKVNFCRRHPRSCMTIFCIFFNLWRKNMENSVMRKKNDFHHQTTCRAPVCWLKYSTIKTGLGSYKVGLKYFVNCIVCSMHFSLHINLSPVSSLFLFVHCLCILSVFVIVFSQVVDSVLVLSFYFLSC